MDKHQSNAEQDAVFVRNFAIVLLFLTVIGVGVYFLAVGVNAGFEETTRDDASVAARVAPVGRLNTSGEVVSVASTNAAPDAGASAEAAPAVASGPGEAAYNKVCFACHAQGIAGAPKMGDTAAWEPRIAQGVDTLYKHAIEGFQGQAGMMPAKGGGTDLSDGDVKAAVDFMIKGEDAAAAPADAPAAAVEATPAAEAAPAADAAAAPAVVADTGAEGKEVYDGVCFVCHTPGAAGAPKIGDAANWGPRVAQGNDVLYDHALNGYMGQGGMMPPKGGRPDIPDADVKAAVDYMVNSSK